MVDGFDDATTWNMLLTTELADFGGWMVDPSTPFYSAGISRGRLKGISLVVTDAL